MTARKIRLQRKGFRENPLVSGQPDAPHDEHPQIGHAKA